MGKKLAKLKLSREEEEYLLKITSTGTHSAATINHAHILLKSNEGWENKDIAKAFHVNDRMIQRVRKRYREQGLKPAVFRKKRSKNKNQKLDGEKEARLIQIACTQPPEGYAKWSLRMLANKMIELEIIDNISYETVRRTLKKMNLNHT